MFAHVAPTFDENGRITNYHSNRRAPDHRAVERVEQLYGKLLAEERRYASQKEGMDAAVALLTSMLEQAGMSYFEDIRHN